MLKNKKIGFIGAGNMGQAIINGLLAAKAVAKSNIIIYDPDREKIQVLKKKGLRIAADNEDLIDRSDIIILAIKPQLIDEILEDIKESRLKACLLISIAAGITTGHIENLLARKVALIRVMPNTPALIREGVTAICRGRFASVGDEKMAEAIFSSVGKTVKVDESLMNAVTGVSGSGPAYIFLIIETLIESGRQVGLSREKAEILARQTVLGAAMMAMQSGDDEAILRKKVTSPGGTTEAALKYMDKKKFTRILIDAVKIAAARAKELGK
jgi:pyrroline-5-carboxylate reductase